MRGQNLKNQFLIAMPGLQDINFSRTITYLCEYNEEGAMGIVINRPSELNLHDILEQMEIAETQPQYGRKPVFFGGPVAEQRGFVLHENRGDWNSSVEISDDIHLTTSRDILEAMAEGKGPENALIALGCAGWGAGQLEEEIQANSWLTCPKSNKILFQTPIEQRWEAAAKSIGVDMNLLSGQAGHA